MFILRVLNKNKGLRFFIINLLCILFFSLIYYLEDVIYFNEKTLLDYFYFSLVTQTTVGYGDITPREKGFMKFISFCQLISILLISSIH